ncbi:hypothetical protein BLNAU_14864 [Blattamonas nauphoetae]|uniref:Transmembrane protein n=1 Tax=Blattamonas nauphoetae TaxID=2049346 RepID=A0ABQ9XFT9_9EUKA|nr:hypothetical protein BLNAU_14864 [Blattamonas nauphoetae]
MIFAIRSSQPQCHSSSHYHLNLLQAVSGVPERHIVTRLSFTISTFDHPQNTTRLSRRNWMLPAFPPFYSHPKSVYSVFCHFRQILIFPSAFSVFWSLSLFISFCVISSSSFCSLLFSSQQPKN